MLANNLMPRIYNAVMTIEHSNLIWTLEIG